MVDDVGAALFYDYAAVHEHDLVGDFAGEADFVGHAHHGHTFLGQGTHDVEHFAHQFGVKGGGRLIEEHDLRLHGQSTGNGHALLLTTRQLGGVIVHAIAQTDALKLGHGQVTGGFLGLVLHVDRGFHHVFQRGHVREQVEALEHHAEARALCGDLLIVQGLQHVLAVFGHVLVADEFAVHLDGTAGQGFQLVDQTQERGLAGTGGPQNHGHSTGHNG